MKNKFILPLFVLLMSGSSLFAQGNCQLTVISTTPATPGYCDGQVVILRVGCSGSCTYMYDPNSPNAIYSIEADTITVDSVCAGTFQFAMACDSSAGYCQVLVQSTGVSDPVYGSSEIGIFPNPSVGFTRIELGFIPSHLTVMKIIDAAGKQIKSYPLENKSSLRLETKDLGPGLYYLIILHDGKMHRQKLCVIHD